MINTPIRRFYFFCICLFFLCFVGCKNDLKKIHNTIDRNMLNTERAEEVTILYSKDGHTTAKLYTKKFIHIENTDPTYIEMKEGIKVEFFDDSLFVKSTLTAKYGKYFENSGNVLVRDSVVVSNNKKETLHTEELVWSEKLKKMYTDKFVKITTPTQVIFGDGLESNQTFSVYKITNVKGMIGISNKALPIQ